MSNMKLCYSNWFSEDASMFMLRRVFCRDRGYDISGQKNPIPMIMPRPSVLGSFLLSGLQNYSDERLHIIDFFFLLFITLFGFQHAYC
jgi:hypothetical protein